MRTIGLIGGITWHSTLDYYRLLNETVNRRMGGAHSAKIIMDSIDFAPIREMTFAEDWDGLAHTMIKSAQKLEMAGASCLLIGANTMHHIADRVQDSISIPLVHIAEATGAAVQKAGITQVALLGTRYTMKMEFYKNKLAGMGISTLIPDEEAIDFINSTIYEEFANGVFTDAAREQYLQIIEGMAREGACGVIMGCTEIPILLKNSNCSIPLFDTAKCHAEAAVNLVME